MSWTMPDWMKKYEPYIAEMGVLSVEATMNTYGAKAAHLIGTRTDEDAVALRAAMVNAQVGLLAALKGAGMLKEAGDAR